MSRFGAAHGIDHSWANYLRFYFTPIRMAKIKNSVTAYAGKDLKRNNPPLLMGFQTCITTQEINLVVSQKIGICSTWRPSYTTPGHAPKRCSTRPERHVIHYVHSTCFLILQKSSEIWQLLFSADDQLPGWDPPQIPPPEISISTVPRDYLALS